MRHFATSAFSLILGIATATHAAGWTVSRTDSTARFQVLQDAIDGAAEGDTLWLDHGSYGAGNVDKRLTFVGRQASTLGRTYVNLYMKSSASGSAVYGIDGSVVAATSELVSSLEVGFSVLHDFNGVRNSYIHHSVIRKVGIDPAADAKGCRFEHDLIDEYPLGHYSDVTRFSQNILEFVTSTGGVSGSENLILNSLLHSDHWAEISANSHYRNVLFHGDSKIATSSSCVNCIFSDSLKGASPWSDNAYHLASAGKGAADDGTDLGIYGGRFPMQWLGDPGALIPRMPFPWLRQIALDRPRAASSDSLRVFIEAESGR